MITRLPFFKNSGLGKSVLIGVFVVKVLAGLGYAYFYNLPAYHADSDTFRFFNYSLAETDLLLHQPWQFVKSFFTYGYSSAGNLFVGNNSYWNDLKSNTIIKLLAVCNVFTFKSYYANIVWFNFFFLFGVIAFFRLMDNLFPGRRMWLLLAICCMPSFLFWCSGIHKDGLLFTALGMLLWLFYQSLNNGFTAARIAAMLGCMLLLFLMRNYVSAAMVPALLAWYLARHYGHGLRPFVYVYACCVILFFALAYVHPALNFPQYIAARQQEFMALQGGSAIPLKPVQAGLPGFIKTLPQAVDMALLRPHFTEARNKSYLPAIAEVCLSVVLLMAWILLRDKTKPVPPAVWACWFIALSLLLIAGYTITLSGAIVRYRSLVLPLLFAPLIGLIRKDKLPFVKTL
jgi:hypothetical protein